MYTKVDVVIFTWKAVPPIGEKGQFQLEMNSAFLTDEEYLTFDDINKLSPVGNQWQQATNVIYSRN